MSFPPDPEDELALRFALLRTVASKPDHVFQLGIRHGQSKRDERIEFFRTLIIRPFADELSHRLGEAADLATPEARTVQAVPLNRIPTSKEIKAGMFGSSSQGSNPSVFNAW